MIFFEIFGVRKEVVFGRFRLDRAVMPATYACATVRWLRGGMINFRAAERRVASDLPSAERRRTPARGPLEAACYARQTTGSTSDQTFKKTAKRLALSVFKGAMPTW